MTKEQLLALCEEIKDKFQLKDWTVKFFVDEVVGGDPNAWGHCEVIYGRKYANITLADDLLKQSEFAINQVIAHELIHVHLHHIYESTKELMDPLSEDLRQSLTNILRLELERSTDALSYVVADLLKDGVAVDEAEVAETNTDTDVFKHVLAIIRVVYRGTKDEALKSFIKTELQRVSGKDQHVDDALKSCERFDKMTESLNRR